MELDVDDRLVLAQTTGMLTIFEDPISFEIMDKAMMTSCGHSFSEESITSWLQKHHYCPLCNKGLKRSGISPNYALRNAIMRFTAAQKKLQMAQIESSFNLSDHMWKLSNEDAVYNGSKLLVEIINARDIKADWFGNADPYCVVEFQDQSKKTKIARRTRNPKWEETFVFNIGNIHTEASMIYITLYDKHRIAKDIFLGMVTIPVADIHAQVKIGRRFLLQKKHPESRKKIRGDIFIRLQSLDLGNSLKMTHNTVSPRSPSVASSLVSISSPASSTGDLFHSPLPSSCPFDPVTTPTEHSAHVTPALSTLESRILHSLPASESLLPAIIPNNNRRTIPPLPEPPSLYESSNKIFFQQLPAPPLLFVDASGLSHNTLTEGNSMATEQDIIDGCIQSFTYDLLDSLPEGGGLNIAPKTSNTPESCDPSTCRTSNCNNQHSLHEDCDHKESSNFCINVDAFGKHDDSPSPELQLQCCELSFGHSEKNLAKLRTIVFMDDDDAEPEISLEHKRANRYISGNIPLSTVESESFASTSERGDSCSITTSVNILEHAENSTGLWYYLMVQSRRSMPTDDWPDYSIIKQS